MTPAEDGVQLQAGSFLQRSVCRLMASDGGGAHFVFTLKEYTNSEPGCGAVLWFPPTVSVVLRRVTALQLHFFGCLIMIIAPL